MAAIVTAGRAPERIGTGRLLLRRFREADRSGMIRFYGDPAVMAIRKYGARPPAAASAAFDILLDHWNAHGFGLYAVTEADGGVLCGECGLRFTDDGSEIEISYGLFPEFRGQGYASEMAAAIRKMAFSDLGLDGFVARSRGDNRASHKVLERIGMRLVERDDASGHGHGVVKYEIKAACGT